MSCICSEVADCLKTADASKKIDNKYYVFMKIIGYIAVATIIITVLVMRDSCEINGHVQSSTITKIGGTIFNNNSLIILENGDFDKQYYDLWSYMDVIITPFTGKFFIPTNVVVTVNQTLSFGLSNISCTTNKNNCVIGGPYMCKITGLTLGITTGKCVPKNKNESEHVCQTYGWNPLEKEHLQPPFDKRPLVENLNNATVFIQNTISFPDVTGPYYTTNFVPADESDKRSEMPDCIYDKQRDPFCPVFNLHSVIEGAEVDYTSLATRGGAVQILISWNCFMISGPKECKPSYSFAVLDDANHKSFDYGWFTKKKVYTGKFTRTLIKLYGIQFEVIVTGIGRKFSMLQCTHDIGSMLVYFGIVGLLLTIAVRCCFSNKKHDNYESLNGVESSNDQREERDLQK